MASIVAYRKHIDEITTKTLQLPEDDKHQFVGQELATVDGVTYVSLPDGVKLPEDQPKEIKKSIKILGELDPILKASIGAASPVVQFINSQVRDMIRARYSVEDEIKAMRLAPSDETSVWNAYVEECRAWGRGKKAELGL